MNHFRIHLRLAIPFVTIVLLFLVGGGLSLRQTQLLSSDVADIALQGLSGASEAAFITLVEAQQRAIWFSMATAVFAILATILLWIWIVRSIRQPLQQLDSAARAWATGDLSSRVTVMGDDELAHLGRVFNEGAERFSDLYLNQELLVAQRTAELKFRAIQLETGAALSQRIAVLLDAESLLEESIHLIQTNFDFDYVGVFLVDPSRKRLVLKGSTAGLDRPVSFVLAENSVVGQAALTQQPRLIPDRLAEGMRYESHRPDSRTALAVPLVVREELLGVLDIQCSQPNRIGEADIAVFQGIAAQIAIALSNAAVYQEEQTQRRFAEILQEIGRDLTSTFDLSEILDLVLARIRPLVVYDRASILLWNGDELEITAAVGFPEGLSPVQSKVPIRSIDRQDVFVRIYHSKQPLIVNNVPEYPCWSGVENLPLPGSWLGVPLVRDSQVVGMLSLTKIEAGHYRPQDARIAQAFGVHAAVALTNAQYYNQIKTFSEYLEDQVAIRTHDLQEAYHRLERLDHTKESFISVTSHELRTPITVIKGYSEILACDPEIQENNYYMNLLEGMIKGANRMHEVVDMMLDMARIDGDSFCIYPEPISMYRLLQDVLAGLGESLLERNLEVSLEPSLLRIPSIQADADGLQKAFIQLILNSIKYTPDGGRITIDGWAWHSNIERLDRPEQGVEIVVRDTGIGINQDVLELIFEKFYQMGDVALHSSGKTKFKGGGFGLGLAIVKGIVETHGGTVWAESEGNDEDRLPGSRFHVVLPLKQDGVEEPFRIDLEEFF